MIPSLWDQIESSLRLAENGQKLDLHRDENEQSQVENLSTRKLEMFQIFSLRIRKRLRLNIPLKLQYFS
jgi:hypothetical protein